MFLLLDTSVSTKLQWEKESKTIEKYKSGLLISGNSSLAVKSYWIKGTSCKGREDVASQI